jgi:cytidine deaminase
LSGSERPKSWPDQDNRAGSDRRSGVDRRRGGPDARPAAQRAKEGERRMTAAGRPIDRRKGDRRNEAAWRSVPMELTMSDEATEKALIIAATSARMNARAHYSGFAVGAALETPEGDTITGCNVENATYGLTLCAERVALVKALSEGHVAFTRVVVVADTEEPTPPCGSCRQLLWEYCGDVDVILANLKGPTARYRLSELLPVPFDGSLLK